MSILQAENITKVYGKRTVVRDMSFAVPAQSITALTGPSGSGKSTILNMIGMLESVDGGRILFNGEPLPSINSRAATRLRREHINYLFQSFALISDISVRENLLLAMKYVDASKKEKSARIDEALGSLGIAILADVPVNTLSGGEAQRVALARCIVKPGELILADEPTGSLDEENALNVFRLLEQLRDTWGKTIIVVTHDTDLAKRSDHIISLNIQA